jgi:hypothetical protein
MSYDLRLFRLPPGADPREAFARYLQAEEQDVLAGDAAHRTVQDDSARAGMERLAGLLTARHPAFERFHPQSPLPWIELNDEARQVQVTISAESAGITMPYFRQEASEMMQLAALCIEVLEKDAGFVAYDPQLDRVVRHSDLANSLAAYREMDRLLPELTRHDGRPKRKPWWKFW